MTWIDAVCIIYGADYSPTLAEERARVSFLEKNEAGEIGPAGRYRGLPTPYGSSTLAPPCQATKENAQYGLEWLLKAVLSKRAAFEEAGADKITIDLNVSHDGQCNLEFSSNLLKLLADSGVNFTMSCYEDPEKVQRMVQKGERDGRA